MTSRLCALGEFGQSIWVDDVGRQMLDGGMLRGLIEEDCVTGLTSNPVLFEHAVRGSSAYDATIEELARSGEGVGAIYERLAIDDIQRAADLFRPAYVRSGGRDDST